jgi:hypothetical protein
MTTDTGMLGRATAPEDLEEDDLEGLRDAARELERAGDWAGALMAYETILARTEYDGHAPDPRLLIKLGDLLVKTASPKLAVRMFERAAHDFAAKGSHRSVIALGIKILRTDRDRYDVFVRFAKLLLEQGYIEESRLVLVDYAERAWARRTLQTLKRLEQAPTDEVLRTLRKLIAAVEETFTTKNLTGKVVVPDHTEHRVPDDPAETERPEAPQDRAAFDAVRPSHRGPWSAPAAVPHAVEGPSSSWRGAAALPPGQPAPVLRPDRTLGSGRRATMRPLDLLLWLHRVLSGMRHGLRATTRHVARFRGASVPLLRSILIGVGGGTAAYLLGPPAFRTMTAYVERATARPLEALPAVVVTPTIDAAPTFSAGGFLAVQDTAIHPLRWDPSLADLPIVVAGEPVDEGTAMRRLPAAPPNP